MSLPFLLEIGSEEIPDWMIEPALADLKRLFNGVLESKHLGGEVTRVDATPRRLVLWAEGLSERQSDSEEQVLGPAKAAAFKDGKPAGAALGFAKKMGVDVSELGVTTTAKGEYLSFVKKIPGRSAAEILGEELPGIIGGIHFPKTMYWTGKNGPHFIRPIRWIIALLGDGVVPFEFAGVASGSVSFGHRQQSKGPVPVTIAGYETSLRGAGVIVAAGARREKITAEIAKLLDGTGLLVQPDEKLLNTLVYLTENPTPILGRFEEEFLQLPKEVLVTVMRHHQRYFSLVVDSEDVLPADAPLAPAFIAVTNATGDPEGLIRRGHERVLRARFKDAQFFFHSDRQKKLEQRLEDLAHVTFQAKLGSYKDKTDRVVKLATELAVHAKANLQMVERAALLCKCDLPTEMVKEFTDLQGIMGGLYAQAEGEPSEIWQAIYGHYKPLSMEDSIPPTLAGRVLSLADKLDTLRGCFAVGMIPSGSKDPFALRRAAQGVVKILVEGKLHLSLSELAGDSQELRAFFLERLQHYFREVRGFQYDEVNAVLAAGADDLPDVQKRLEAIQAVRPTANFEPLAASFKRIQNILRQAQFTGAQPVQESLLEPGPEGDLYAAFTQVREAAANQRQAHEYLGALQTIAGLRPQVDLFFDKVLVNAPDQDVRRNRLSLLYTLLTESSTIADFSEIVTGS